MSTATTEWPYDADRDDPLTALRIPVTSAWPEWKYVATFDRESAERPTDAEAAMLSSFIAEYGHHWFVDWFVRKQLQKPFDVEGRQRTTVFRKLGPDRWAYRKVEWERGPFVVPPEGEPLAELMDRIHTIVDEPMRHWLEWKAAHPEVFGGDT